MASTTLSSVRIAGIASAVPSGTRDVSHVSAAFGADEATKLAESTGVRTRHVVSDRLCASDLCQAAADTLLAELAVARESIDALIFVSQSPDYVLPATACVLQGRLGLPKTTAAFDVNLGCSGYVYGLWMSSALIASGAARRVLLLVGDTISRHVAPKDRATATIFGDAGSATLLEHDASAGPSAFVTGTDGKGAQHLIVPAGGQRTPSSAETSRRAVREGGNERSDEDLFMNGPEIFTFTLREVPALIDATLKLAGWERDQVESFVFHQANRFMLTHLAKKMKLPEQRVVLALEDFGNTSGASIPLAISTTFGGKTGDAVPDRVVLAGFGVGLSWGAVATRLRGAVLPKLVVVPDPGAAMAASG